MRAYVRPDRKGPRAYLNRNRRGKNPFSMPPGFTTYYAIGAMATKRLPVYSTWKQIGRELSIPHQSAYTEGILALGKLLYGIAKIIQERPEL